MSEENKNLNEVEDVLEEEVLEEETKLEKAKTGIKKHGKTIGMIVGAVTLGIIGYALGKRSSYGDNYDDIIDAENYVINDENPTE